MCERCGWQQAADTGRDILARIVRLPGTEARRMAGSARCVQGILDWVVSHSHVTPRQRATLDEIRKRVNVPPRQATVHDHYARLHLLSSAPSELVKAAYRCLSLIYHPDRGGNEELMKEINVAYEAIKKSESRRG